MLHRIEFTAANNDENPGNAEEVAALGNKHRATAHYDEKQQVWAEGPTKDAALNLLRSKAVPSVTDEKTFNAKAAEAKKG